MRRALIALITLIVTTATVAAAGSAGAERPGRSGPEEAPLAVPTDRGGTGATGRRTPACEQAKQPVTRDVEYLDEPIDARQRLDVFAVADGKECAPVVVWVHGGGWAVGDKRRIEHKAELFNGLGYVFVSVNYRLSQPRNDPARPVHPAHADDVGAAVAWVEDHVADYGGDGREILLLGHSAGAHLVALVGLDPTYVEDAGGDIDAVRCVIANDGAGYDIPGIIGAAGRAKAIYENAFGADPAVQADASPVNHVDDREELPEVLLISRGAPARIAIAQRLADDIEAAGGTASVLDANPYTHGDVNQRLGEPGEQVVTPPVTELAERCLGTS